MLWRVLALFQRKRRARLAILFLCCGNWLVEVVILILFFNIRPLIQIQPSGITSCGCWPTFPPDEPSSRLPLVMLPSAFALHSTLLLLTVFNPHTVRQQGHILLSPVIRILRGEVALYLGITLLAYMLNATTTAAFTRRVPGTLMGIPIMIGWQTIGPCRQYLHLKSSQWYDNESSLDNDTDPTAMPDASMAQTMSSTWASSRSARSPEHSGTLGRRGWTATPDVRPARLDPTLHGEVVEVFTTLEEE